MHLIPRIEEEYHFNIPAEEVRKKLMSITQISTVYKMDAPYQGSFTGMTFVIHERRKSIRATSLKIPKKIEGEIIDRGYNTSSIKLSCKVDIINGLLLPVLFLLILSFTVIASITITIVAFFLSFSIITLFYFLFKRAIFGYSKDIINSFEKQLIKLFH